MNFLQITNRLNICFRLS